ncbi:rhomboid family protein [Ascoidea rubescens DSM 1968]|uniref:Rhomboid-type serine protease n=1 Tax=Ascoidea rubescens DSM 1968 TaxID=1344418 RepID=A0A1D2VQN9_9ASCO|nr:rhomboid-domain-containing protein [Ascoidea rubescens DSM 1968]ODV63936.1 rhomboid-domain-containing protein [Ascoidea rubescens DSM 1968]
MNQNHYYPYNPLSNERDKELPPTPTANMNQLNSTGQPQDTNIQPPPNLGPSPFPDSFVNNNSPLYSPNAKSFIDFNSQYSHLNNPRHNLNNSNSTNVSLTDPSFNSTINTNNFNPNPNNPNNPNISNISNISNNSDIGATNYFNNFNSYSSSDTNPSMSQSRLLKNYSGDNPNYSNYNQSSYNNGSNSTNNPPYPTSDPFVSDPNLSRSRTTMSNPFQDPNHSKMNSNETNPITFNPTSAIPSDNRNNFNNNNNIQENRFFLDNNNNNIYNNNNNDNNNDNNNTYNSHIISDQQVVDKKNSRWKTFPYVAVFFTIVETAVFIAELVNYSKYTGNVIQTSPSFNPMLGPSSYVQINMGSRFRPCMQEIEGITNVNDILFPCPNSTTTDTDVCSLSELCGMGGLPPNTIDDELGYLPDQWWRIITPIFLHAGFIHIISNLLLQILLGADVEKKIGSLTFLIIYIASGISGNIFGANYSKTGVSSVGASGALFGIIATNLFHHLFLFNKALYSKKTYRIILSVMVFEIILILFLGLLPGLDNFAHIGGFIIGLLCSILLLRDPNFIIKEEYRYIPPKTMLTPIPNQGSHVISRNFLSLSYDDSNDDSKPNSKISNFLKKRYIKYFIFWCVLRTVSLVLIILWFVLLSINFFKNGGGNCSWCQYLSCIPVNNWCDGDITVTTSDSSIYFFNFLTLLFYFIGLKNQNYLNLYHSQKQKKLQKLD